MDKRKIKVLIWAILWVIGIILLIDGNINEDAFKMTIGGLFLVSYGLTETIKFILGFPFDLFANAKRGTKRYFLALFLSFILVLICGPTGVALLISPIVSPIVMIRDFLKVEKKDEQVEEAIYYSRRQKYTFVGVLGIVLGIATAAIIEITLSSIQLDGVYQEFLPSFLLLSGIIMIILSIRIGYKWGSFGEGTGKKEKYKEITINGKKYFVKIVNDKE